MQICSSISKLYYRSASAVVLVYSIIDEKAFEEMGSWRRELNENAGPDVMVHVVGTKSDVTTRDFANLYPEYPAASTFFAGRMNGVHSLDSK